MAIEPRLVGGSSGSQGPSGPSPRRLWPSRALLLAAGFVLLLVGSFLLLGGGPSAGHSAGTATGAASPGGPDALALSTVGLGTPDSIVGPELGVGLAAPTEAAGAPPSRPQGPDAPPAG